MGQHGLERATAAAARQQARDWDRYLSCTYVPHPGQRVAMSDFVRSMHEAKDTQLTETLEACAVSQGRFGLIVINPASASWPSMQRSASL